MTLVTVGEAPQWSSHPSIPAARLEGGGLAPLGGRGARTWVWVLGPQGAAATLCRVLLRTTRSRISSASFASRPGSRSSPWASCCTRAPTCAMAGMSWTSWWFSQGRLPCAPCEGLGPSWPHPGWPARLQGAVGGDLCLPTTWAKRAFAATWAPGPTRGACPWAELADRAAGVGPWCCGQSPRGRGMS